MNMGIFVGEPNVDIIATIIFSTTSGLLTLLALISTFIAINRQHNIEKARELFWELSQFPYKYTRTEYERDSLKIASEVDSKLKLYEITANSKSKHTKKILNIAIIIISIISFIWIISIWGFFLWRFKRTASIFIFNRHNTCDYFFNFYFLRQLYKIFDIEKISNLPKYERLLDIDGLNIKKEALGEQEISDVPQVTKILLLIMGMRMKLHANSQYNPETEDLITDYSLRFLFPGAFYNFRLTALTYFYEAGSEFPLTNKSYIVNGKRYSDMDKSIEVVKDSLRYRKANTYYFLDLFNWSESTLENIDWIRVDIRIDYYSNNDEDSTLKSLFTSFEIKNMKKDIYDFKSPFFLFAVTPSIYPRTLQ